MSNVIRQSPKKLRLWLLAAGVVLLLSSILEAGHVHGVFSATDDACTLCQHSVTLDKVLNTAISLAIPLLLAALVISRIELIIPRLVTDSAHIRAPPAQLHTR